MKWMKRKNKSRKYITELQTRGNNVPGKNSFEIILLTMIVVASLFFAGIAEASTTVRVVSDEGAPLQNVSLFINLKYPDNTKQRLTNAKGEVILDPVAAGKEIAVTAFKTGYFPATVTIKQESTTTIQIRKVLKRLAVTVLDKKGTPLPKIRIATGDKISETNADGIANIDIGFAEKSVHGKILCSEKEARAFAIPFGAGELVKEMRGRCLSHKEKKADKTEKADTAAAALKKPVPEPVPEARKEEQQRDKDKTVKTVPAKPESLKQEKADTTAAALKKPVPEPAPEARKENQKTEKDRIAKTFPTKPDPLPAETAEKKIEPSKNSRPVETASIKPALRPAPDTVRDSASPAPSVPDAVKVTPAIALATEKLDECRSYFREGKFMKAVETCGEIPEERTTSRIYAEAIHVRGLSFLRMDWKQEAKREFQKIVEKVPNYAAPNLELGVINVTEGKSADALSYLISAHAGNTQLGGRDRCRLFLFTAKAYEQLGNYSEAKKYLKGLIELKDCPESDRKSAADKLNEY